MHSAPAVRPAALLLTAALLAGPLVACHDGGEPLAPPAPNVPVRTFTIAPDVLDALSDAESRLAPSLAADARAPMRAALAELRAALNAGARTRSDRALASARALLTPATSDSTADDLADRTAIAMLLTVAMPDTTAPR